MSRSRKIKKIELVGPAELIVKIGSTEFKVFGAAVGDGRAPFDEDCLFVELVEPRSKGKILVHKVE